MASGKTKHQRIFYGVIAAILAGYPLVFYVGGWYNEVNGSLESIEASLTKIEENTQGIQASIEENTRGIQGIQASIEENTRGIQGIQASIEEGFEGLDYTISSQTLSEGALETASPRKFTELGKKISDEMHAKNLAKALAPKLDAAASGLSRYDVQKLSFNYVRDQVKKIPEFRSDLKDVAFENGVSELTVVTVIGLELRDELLASRKK